MWPVKKVQKQSCSYHPMLSPLWDRLSILSEETTCSRGPADPVLLWYGWQVSTVCNWNSTLSGNIHHSFEVHGTVQLLLVKYLNLLQIRHENLAVYESNTILHPAILKWCHEFDQGCTNIADGDLKGRAPTSTTNNNAQAIEELICSCHILFDDMTVHTAVLEWLCNQKADFCNWGIGWLNIERLVWGAKGNRLLWVCQLRR